MNKGYLDINLNDVKPPMFDIIGTHDNGFTGG